MEEILSKLRKKFVGTTALIAGIFLLVILGGFFSILFLTSEAVTSEELNEVLSRHDSFSDNRTLFVFSETNDTYYMDSRTLSNLQLYYGNDVGNILDGAAKEGKGNFSVNDHYFAVKSARYENSQTMYYAVYDRTAERDMLVKTAVIEAVLYIISMLLVTLLAYLMSWRNVRPVKTALEKQRDLISNASHELKTPLTIIATNLDVMKSEPSSTIESNQKWIDSAESQISRMKGLIQNMLELSKLEQSVVIKETVDFSELASGVCLEFEAVCFEKNLRLLSEIKPDIYITGDKASLERLIMILLDNAVKYAGENGKVGLRLCSDSKKLHLSVLNTGDSISKDDAKKVFDRFYRADGARSNPDNQSFGLGLSIAQATVLAHKGQISCRGIENKGTVFDVYLPLTKKCRGNNRNLPDAIRNLKDRKRTLNEDDLSCSPYQAEIFIKEEDKLDFNVINDKCIENPDKKSENANSVTSQNADSSNTENKTDMNIDEGKSSI